MFCECGCGKQVKKGNRFINGHNAKLQLRSKETRKKIGDTNKLRKISENTRKKLRNAKLKDNNPRWKGGISRDPYCYVWYDEEYKNSIKERDGYICLNPACEKKSDKLVLHHINYNKKDCKPSNLITICNCCNSKANINRAWHKSWYKAIIYRRYISSL